jgi:hypothetical protein
LLYSHPILGCCLVDERIAVPAILPLGSFERPWLLVIHEAMTSHGKHMPTLDRQQRREDMKNRRGIR